MEFGCVSYMGAAVSHLSKLDEVQRADWELITTTFLKPGRLFLFHCVSGGVLFNGLTTMFQFLMRF